MVLPELLKHIASLPVGQPLLYYSCVLESASPGSVPMGQTPKFYAQLRKGGTAIVPEPAECEDSAAGGTVAGGGEASDYSDLEPVGSSMFRRAVSAASSKKRKPEAVSDGGSAFWRKPKHVRVAAPGQPDDDDDAPLSALVKATGKAKGNPEESKAKPMAKQKASKRVPGPAPTPSSSSGVGGGDIAPLADC